MEAYRIKALNVLYMFLHVQRKLLWQLSGRLVGPTGARYQGHGRGGSSDQGAFWAKCECRRRLDFRRCMQRGRLSVE